MCEVFCNAAVRPSLVKQSLDQYMDERKYVWAENVITFRSKFDSHQIEVIIANGTNEIFQKNDDNQIVVLSDENHRSVDF
jgi:hypothetical protein